MTHAITNYTTYDQAYYYADLKRLPRFSEEQRRSLMTSLPTADNPTQIKQQLIESYLPLAKYFAIDLCLDTGPLESCRPELRPHQNQLRGTHTGAGAGRH